MVPSKGGTDAHPDWSRNPDANPAVTIRVGSRRYERAACPVPRPCGIRALGMWSSTCRGLAVKKGLVFVPCSTSTRAEILG